MCSLHVRIFGVLLCHFKILFFTLRVAMCELYDIFASCTIFWIKIATVPMKQLWKKGIWNTTLRKKDIDG